MIFRLPALIIGVVLFFSSDEEVPSPLLLSPPVKGSSPSSSPSNAVKTPKSRIGHFPPYLPSNLGNKPTKRTCRPLVELLKHQCLVFGPRHLSSAGRKEASNSIFNIYAERGDGVLRSRLLKGLGERSGQRSWCRGKAAGDPAQGGYP